jgi:hypothetical protein
MSTPSDYQPSFQYLNKPGNDATQGGECSGLALVTNGSGVGKLQAELRTIPEDEAEIQLPPGSEHLISCVAHLVPVSPGGA